jgi:hypothetical protein
MKNQRKKMLIIIKGISVQMIRPFLQQFAVYRRKNGNEK